MPELATENQAAGRRAAARPGFTLMEVLVVITVIAMIIGLMLPALRSSREAARRINCINNLRQIGLALCNYETQCQVFPSGVVDAKGPIRNDQPDGLHIGWLVQLLPYMEQNAIRETINTTLPVYDEANDTAARTTISSFLCPSDPQTGPVGGRSGNSYAACHHDVEAPIDVDNHGVFYLNSSVRKEAITDGTSFTIFVGEKMISPLIHGGWMAGNRATLRNTGSPINTPPRPGGDLVGGYGSYHGGGANFLFGDSAVRFLSERISPRVYRLLGHREDGEPIDDLSDLP